MADTPEPDSQTLKRSLNLPMMVLYGLGTTIGGGIYVLIGSVAGRAGIYAPVSFLLAAFLTAFTALSFAELSARFPKSAGEAVYVEQGWRSVRLAAIVGFLVILSGVVSSAALADGFAGYFRTLLPIPSAVAIIGIVLVLGLVAAWGIGQSVTVAAIVTVAEIGGLFLIIWAAQDAIGQIPARIDELTPPLSGTVWAGILAGSFLAYYAFIGFEDMVNVAEEVRDVERTMPTAIIITLVVTTILYGLVASVSVIALPVGDLAHSEAPLALVYERTSGRSAAVISGISIMAVVNGALIQIIMAARVIYGMSQRGWLPEWIGRVNARTRTPVHATFMICLIVAALSLGFAIDTLAQVVTIGIVATAFLVNSALLRLKLRGDVAKNTLSVHIAIPAIGTVVSVFFAGLAVIDLIGRAS